MDNVFSELCFSNEVSVFNTGQSTGYFVQAVTSPISNPFPASYRQYLFLLHHQE